jgi:hypothetical protein
MIELAGFLILFFSLNMKNNFIKLRCDESLGDSQKILNSLIATFFYEWKGKARKRII